VDALVAINWRAIALCRRNRSPLLPIANQNPSHFPKLSRRALLLAIAVLGLLLLFRFSVLIFSRDAFSDDPDAYRSLAIGLKTSGVYGNSIAPPVQPTAFRPPLYPWLLSLGVDRENRTLSFVFMAAMHTMLGVATCMGTAHLFHALLKITLPNLSRSLQIKGTLASTLIVAVDPILIRQSQLIMTETLATFLSIVTLISLHRLAISQRQSANPFGVSGLWAIVTGLAFGINSLCRPTAVAWFVLVLIGALLLSQFCRSPYKTSLCLVLGFAICILPWGIRNSIHCGKFVFTTTHGGYTLLLANNPSLYDHLDRSWSRNWDESTFFADWSRQSSAASHEIEQDLLARRIALKTIRERPFGFVKSSFARLLWLWAPWPNQGGNLSRAGVGAWYFSVYMASIIGLGVVIGTVRSDHSAATLWMPLLTLILSISIVHSVFWSNMRMRAACMPAVSILASFGVIATLRPRPGPEDTVCSAESML